MSKLGCYIQVGSAPGLREKLLTMRPAVVTIHLDNDLPAWIKQNLPDTFIVGRVYWDRDRQERLLYTPGAGLAADVLAQKGAAACDAFMLFNEYLSSPHKAGWASVPGQEDNARDDGWKAKADRYDALQVEFREALLRNGKEAVAFNFGAGNWMYPHWYRDFQPLTTAAYRYFGHHIYGWPRLVNPNPSWLSSLAGTLAVMSAYGDKTHVVTELAVTRMYADQGPDAGWLSEPNPLTLDGYAEDLRLTQEALCRLPNVIGAALFNAAPEPGWQTFAIPPELATRIAAFPPCTQAPVKPPVVVRLQMPVNHTNILQIITQWFGENPQNYDGMGHEGLDMALAEGTPVFAACAGRVHPTVSSNVYGTYVRVQSSGTLENPITGKRVTGGWETVYAHLSKRTVEPGQWVEAGQKIGEVGNTGRSTGNHLHFGLRLPGQTSKDRFYGYSDPATWLGIVRPTPAKPEHPAKAHIAAAIAALEKAKAAL